MKKNLLLKILLGLLIFQIVAVISVPLFFTVSNGIERNNCEKQRLFIEQKTREYVSSINNKEANYPTDLNELVENGYLKSEDIKCPSGYEYYWNPIDGNVMCSVLEHR